MELKIKSITFSNIMSFGANPTTINFDENLLSLIQGSNGAGKSSMLLDTLSFCLFGKPYRKIKIDEILNRKNKGNLRTSCSFSIGEDEYILTRNKEPDSLKLQKNGNDLELLSTKKLNQSEIDKILGINYEIFKQVISISVTYNKPFLAMDSKEKRKTIEAMFSLGEFSKMVKVLQEKNRTSKKSYDILENNISNLESTIRLFNKQILNFEEQNRTFQIVKKQKIEKHQKEIEDVKNLLDQTILKENPLKENVEKLKEDLKKFDKNKYTTALNKYQKQLNDEEWNVKTLSSQIRKLETETNCPTCKKPFDSTKRLQEISDKNKSKEESEKLLKDVSEKVEKLKTNIKFIEGKESKLTFNQNVLRDIQSDIRDYQRDIKGHEDAIVEIENSKNDIDIDKIRDQIAEKEKELDVSKNKKDIEESKIKNYRIVESILGDDGVKTYIVNKIVPLLNKHIDFYINLFELPIRITFNSSMDEKIISLNNFGNEVSYYSFSEGEKKRLDCAILFSLIEIMKIISNWKCSVLIVDELFDGATDIHGLEQILIAIKKLSEEKNMNISIISHRLNENFSEFFDRKIKVSKNIHGFSEILEEK
jgi:DNA repair exonuclease SbcCD ATPase subunit